MINKKLLDVLKEYKITPDEAIPYLVSIYYNYNPLYIPIELKRKINSTGIVYERNGEIEWKIGLFEGQETTFSWVKDEYVPLFKDANSEKGGGVRESIARMKKFFSENPDIRKDEVIGATKLYLANTDPKYIRKTYYFIFKGSGISKISDLYDWVQKYRESEKPKNIHDVTKKMQ